MDTNMKEIIISVLIGFAIGFSSGFALAVKCSAAGIIINWLAN